MESLASKIWVLKYFLGFEIARSANGIALYQRKYAPGLLKDFGFLGAKPSNTPMDSSLKLHREGGDLLDYPFVYRRLVGRLSYLTPSRPDVCYAVSHLSQYLDKPTSTHLTAAHRVLRFIKSSPTHGLFFPIDSDNKLKGFSNSDWAACPNTRKSVTGMCFFLSSLISWRSKKHAIVSRSSSKAEYMALAQTTCEAQWLRYLLQNLQVATEDPTIIYCDNQSAIHIAANSVFH